MMMCRGVTILLVPSRHSREWTGNQKVVFQYPNNPGGFIANNVNENLKLKNGKGVPGKTKINSFKPNQEDKQKTGKGRKRKMNKKKKKQGGRLKSCITWELLSSELTFF